MRSGQKLALIMASCAAIGLIVWSHILSGSAFRLLHLPDRLHVESKAYQDRAVAPTGTAPTVTAPTATAPTATADVAVTDRQSPVILFDDNAKLAIDAQRRRNEVAQAEKRQAAMKHVNLEWQRHHHLNGSVFKAVKQHL